jgi:hypothetical protein
MARIRLFVSSSIGLVAGAVALLFLHRGWEAADAAFTIARGALLVASVISIGSFEVHRQSQYEQSQPEAPA